MAIALDYIPSCTTKKIERYTDMVDIIEEAYGLYMPQDRYEITELAKFVEQYRLDKRDIGMKTLEIGTKNGGTFFIWCSLFKSAHDLNISIDMSDGGLHGGIPDEVMDKRDLWFKERFSNCQFIRGDSHSKNILNEVTWKLRSNDLKDFSEPTFLDFLFIDGDHTYDGVEKDWKMYSPFVKKGGIIAFHDTVISQRHHDRDVYVGEFWRDLTKYKKSDDPTLCMIDGEWYKIHEFVKGDLDWAGIGVLVKL